MYSPPDGLPLGGGAKELFGFFNIDSCLHVSHYQVYVFSQRQKSGEWMLPEGHGIVLLKILYTCDRNPFCRKIQEK